MIIMAENLMEGLLKELERCKSLKKLYDGLPDKAGVFGSMMIQEAIDMGEVAIKSGDVVQMVKAYESLKSCK